MGSSINNCSTSTIAFNSDSTGGFAWLQWIGGNDLSWDFSTKSNYPYGESVDRPYFVTSTLAIFIYKVLSMLSTPICGLNLVVLLGYMSTALVMFGFIKWLLRRPDIALFAGYAAAFVPYHQLKAQSHVTYIYGGLFIGMVWIYLWFINKPSYKKAALFSLVAATGFYFEGYFVLISGVIVAALFISSFILEGWRWVFAHKRARGSLRTVLVRQRYHFLAAVLLALLLLPIFITYKEQGQTIKQILATSRNNILIESTVYGLRPIEFILPATNNPLMPDGYHGWRVTKIHGSNLQEATLYVGITILLLALVACLSLFRARVRRIKLAVVTYPQLVFVISLVAVACLIISLPPKMYVFGQDWPTPVALLIELTPSWRVFSRLFLAIDPLIIILASCGLYIITKGWRKGPQICFVAICGALLFLEYLPASLNSANDLYRDAPQIYKQLAGDAGVQAIAEYPWVDFRYSPSIFTFQPVHQKLLFNASDTSITTGPLRAAMGGLNDRQALGVLKALKIGVITSYGVVADSNPGLARYLPPSDYGGREITNPLPPIYSYYIKDSVEPRNAILVIDKGYESFFIDNRQISHRAIVGPVTMRIVELNPDGPSGNYWVSFSAKAIACNHASAQVTVRQKDNVKWSGRSSKSPAEVNFMATGDKPLRLTTSCSLDITHLSAEEVPSQ